jgi:hypothetical protein
MQKECQELINGENPEEELVIIKSKRGRKSKKELMEMELLNLTNDENKISTISLFKKNKKKEETEEKKCEIEGECENNAELEPKVFKKRGRKPKGGKIIQPTITDEHNPDENLNVILHLKCNMIDLDNVKNTENEGLDAYNTHIYNDFIYNYSKLSDPKFTPTYINSNNELSETECDTDDVETTNKDNAIKEIWKKLKQLECNLHVNNISKKSCCFWDTCEFDTPPIYIPKYFINKSYHVYGCFCSPECAVAYLNNEQLDRSSKSERYQLLHDVYSKIYEYENPIKEASDPRYLLDKFFGNLSIKEYRNLLKYGTSYHVIDKPLTKVYPEIHENSEDYILNNKTIPSNHRIQGKSLNKKQNKTLILNENFGIG